MPYGLSIHRLYKEKRKGQNKEIKNDKIWNFKNILVVEEICWV